MSMQGENFKARSKKKKKKEKKVRGAEFKGFHLLQKKKVDKANNPRAFRRETYSFFLVAQSNHCLLEEYTPVKRKKIYSQEGPRPKGQVTWVSITGQGCANRHVI